MRICRSQRTSHFKGSLQLPPRLTRARKHADVRKVVPNELRQSAATLLAREVPLHHVAETLGHGGEVTDTYYWHCDQDLVEDHLRLFG